MFEAKVVIGANYGDEGKGLMTDYFAARAKAQNRKSIVVLSNGGAQRGHTVIAPTGFRHVFHHFGSGTFQGAASYYPDVYIINPSLWLDEYEELLRVGYRPVAFANRCCQVSTPFDMIINQISEESRGNARHGSCGVGIWETIMRAGKNLTQLKELGREGLKAYLEDIRDNYLPARLKVCGVEKVSDDWARVIANEGIIDAFIDDFFLMLDIMGEPVDDDILLKYETVIFECGQGLLLDRCNRNAGVHTTPSNTGIRNPAAILRCIGKENADIEVCYVSRTYMTRHGAGPFAEECSKEEINKDMVDITNVPNIHQGTIRYGFLDAKAMKRRCREDYDSVHPINGKMTIAMTHLNEYCVKEDLDGIDYVSSIEGEVSKVIG